MMREVACGWRVTFGADPVGWTLGWMLEERDDGGEWFTTAWFRSSQDAAQWLTVQGFPNVAVAVAEMVGELVERARAGVDPLGG